MIVDKALITSDHIPKSFYHPLPFNHIHFSLHHCCLKSSSPLRRQLQPCRYFVRWRASRPRLVAQPSFHVKEDGGPTGGEAEQDGRGLSPTQRHDEQLSEISGTFEGLMEQNVSKKIVLQIRLSALGLDGISIQPLVLLSICWVPLLKLGLFSRPFYKFFIHSSINSSISSH